MSYYQEKLGVLRELFGQEVLLSPTELRVGESVYPIVDDVIVLLDPDRDLCSETRSVNTSFGREWGRFDQVLPEHSVEFDRYFDLVDLEGLAGLRVCDLGCGSGRWSHFLSRYTQNLVLVDFSEAIFVARRNLSHVPTALFFQADARSLPFRQDAFDFLVCLGVLHHLPENALILIQGLRNLAPRHLYYLYYALDNRGPHFQLLWQLSDSLRRALCRLRSEPVRLALAGFLTWTLYRPLIALGGALERVGMGSRVPLYEAYRNSTTERIKQDCYDRFFTPIEQRFKREQILQFLTDFSQIVISPDPPYWHFLCRR